MDKDLVMSVLGLQIDTWSEVVYVYVFFPLVYTRKLYYFKLNMWIIRGNILTAARVSNIWVACMSFVGVFLYS